MMVARAHCSHGREVGRCMECSGKCINGHDVTGPNAMVWSKGKVKCRVCRDLCRVKGREHRARRVRLYAQLPIGKRPPCPKAGHDLNLPGAIARDMTGGDPYCVQCRNAAPARGGSPKAAAMLQAYLDLSDQLEREPRAWVREELRNQLAKMAKEMGRE